MLLRGQYRAPDRRRAARCLRDRDSDRKSSLTKSHRRPPGARLDARRRRAQHVAGRTHMAARKVRRVVGMRVRASIDGWRETWGVLLRCARGLRHAHAPRGDRLSARDFVCGHGRRSPTFAASIRAHGSRWSSPAPFTSVRAAATPCSAQLAAPRKRRRGLRVQPRGRRRRSVHGLRVRPGAPRRDRAIFGRAGVVWSGGR